MQERDVVHETGSSHNKSGLDLSWMADLAYLATGGQLDNYLQHFTPVDDSPGFVGQDAIGKQVVSGHRGMGKSTLLLYRMRHLESKGYRMVRHLSPYGYRLSAKSLEVSGPQLLFLSRPEVWTAIWNFVLEALWLSAIVREDRSKRPADKQEEWLKIFGVASPGDETLRRFVNALRETIQNPRGESLHTLVQPLIDSQSSSATLEVWRQKRMKEVILQRKSANQPTEDNWVVFVDCIDEALAYRGEDGKVHALCSPATVQEIHGAATRQQDWIARAFGPNPVVDRLNIIAMITQVWQAAQTGFAYAADHLRQTTAALFAFGSFRAETTDEFVANASTTRAKSLTFIHRIERSESWLQSIFELNANRLMPDRLAASARGDEQTDLERACMRLSGHRKLANRRIPGASETVYDMARRHNFGTPRGLMVLGRAVCDIRLSDGGAGRIRPENSVIEAINTAAADVLIEHRSTLTPPWDTRFESAGEKLLVCNIIPRQLAQRIESAFERRWRRRFDSNPPSSLFGYLRSTGLVGAPLTVGGRLIQHFWQPGDGEFKENSIPEYYLIHPAYAAYLFRRITVQTRQESFYCPQLLVNPGAPCSATFLPTVIEIIIRKHDTRVGVTIRLTDPERKEIFDGGVTSVGAMFLLILTVSRGYDRSEEWLLPERLLKVTRVLRDLKVLPEFIGNKGSPEKLVKDACSIRRTGLEGQSAPAFNRAKELLKKARATGLSLHSHDQPEGERSPGVWYRVAFRGKDLAPSQVVIRGLEGLDPKRSVNRMIET